MHFIFSGFMAIFIKLFKRHTWEIKTSPFYYPVRLPFWTQGLLVSISCWSFNDCLICTRFDNFIGLDKEGLENAFQGFIKQSKPNHMFYADTFKGGDSTKREFCLSFVYSTLKRKSSVFTEISSYWCFIPRKNWTFVHKN